jgi:molybdopterin-guanine dinucleotide biosynthesis protein
MQTNQQLLDYIGSSTAPCNLTKEVSVTDYILAEDGYCVVVQALEDKEVYNQIECTDHTFRTIRKGDIFATVLGERQALKGYSGRLPRHIAVGDTLNILNMGGITGMCVSEHPELGPPLKVRVMGAIVKENAGSMRHVCIQEYAIEYSEVLENSAPIVMVSGTSMNTGKTYACAQIVQQLTERGLKVAAAKLTGASLMRDTRAMKESGAIAVHTFTDAGIVTSTSHNIVPAAKGIIQKLNSYEPDVIVAELGDGFIGYYGVDDILGDKEIQKFVAAHVVATIDLVGAWASREIFKDRYHAKITMIVGPVTDNAVGKRYIQQSLGITALNAKQDGEAFGDVISKSLEVYSKKDNS